MKALIADGPNKGETLNVSDGIDLIQIKNATGGMVSYYNTREVDNGSALFSINEPRRTVALREFVARCEREREG